MHAPDRTCSDVTSQLPLFVGGDLEAPFVEGVREHLAACPECRGELERMRASRNLLLGLRAVAGVSSEASDEELDLWPRLREELAAAGAFVPVAKTATPVHWMRWAAAATAAGLLGALLWIGWSGGTSPEAIPGQGGGELAAETQPGASSAGPLPAGMRLQRAAPGDERMADSAQPFLTDPNGQPLLPDGRRAGHVLAGENGLR